jgi:prophage regulatory protein
MHMTERKFIRNKARFIRKAEVLYRIGRSNSALYQMIAAGGFPAPLHPDGCRTSVWVEADVDKWINDRMAEAGKEVAA